MTENKWKMAKTIYTPFQIVQASTLTYFSTCPFGQLTKKSTCPTQSFKNYKN
jgi:hypothetical protein